MSVTVTHMVRLEAGSMPEVGSSSNTTDDPPMSARPTLNFRFVPPEYLDAT